MKDNIELSSRGWLLLFFEAAERNGIYPIAMDMLHKLIYLANVLSPVSDVKMPNHYTLKHRRGPYFPRAQLDIGILVAQQLVESQSVVAIKDEHGFWLKGNYRITKEGLDITEEINDDTILENYSIFLREFFRSLTYLSKIQIHEINNFEIHYKTVSDGLGVDISTPDNNFTKEAISNLFPPERSQTTREGIHRYISYLKNAFDNMGAKHNEN